MAGTCSQNARPSHIKTDTVRLAPRISNPVVPRRRWRDLIRRDLKTIDVKEEEWYTEATTSRMGWRATYQLGMEDETVKQHQTR